MVLAQPSAAGGIKPTRRHAPPAASLPELTASEALELLERGALTSEEYVAALLRRADGLAGLNVFISRDSGAALSAARAADRRRAAGLPVGLEVDGLEGGDERVPGIGLSVETALEGLPPPTIP